MKLTKVLMFTAGILSASALAQSKDYSGAELYTRDTQMYGKYEARMYMAAGSGIVSSMFLYHNDSYLGGDEPWVEVDIEILGKAPASFQSNIITGTADSKKTSEKHHALSPAANKGYHTYGMEWTPTYVSWIIDGVTVRKTMTDSNDTKGQVAALIREQGLRFNLWSSESEGWVGAFDESILPVHQYIDWVKVYSYTPGAGENGSGFTLAWTDDFNEFDDSRWATGDWTFDGNRVTMSPDNVSIADGHLVLSLTKAGSEGFQGTVPTDAIRKNNGGIRAGVSRPEYLSTFDLMGRYKGLAKK
jgi:endo-1,3-1,4-beta-glycanase ExoK